MNQARQNAFIAAMVDAEERFFGPELGKRRLILQSLVVDLAYHGHRIGRALVEWGLQKAQEEGLAAHLTSSPIGRRLYGMVGFQEVGIVKVKVEGEDEVVTIPAMVWLPRG